MIVSAFDGVENIAGKGVMVWEWVKEFADNNLSFEENVGKFSKRVENTVR